VNPLWEDMMRLVLRLGIPTLIAGFTFVACASTAGSGVSAPPATSAPATSAAAPSAAAPKTATVTIKGFAFSPATLTVAKGTVVTFTNQDSTTHTVSSGANRTKDGKFDAQVSGGTETQMTFDTAGTFAYFCSFHQSMVATVVVN
jgi:plastocyanin